MMAITAARREKVVSDRKDGKDAGSAEHVDFFQVLSAWLAVAVLFLFWNKAVDRRDR